MKTPGPRTRKFIALSTAPVAVLAAGVLVWQGSQAAFTATTANNGNTWSSGKLTLTDDDQGTAAFHVENLVPGQSGSKCIAVTTTSNVPGQVRNYVRHLTVSGQGLEDHLMLKIETGTGGSSTDCSTFTPALDYTPVKKSLTALAKDSYDFNSGGVAWKTSGTPGGETRTYKASWNFDTTGMSPNQVDALQGSQVSVDFAWELQNDEPA